MDRENSREKREKQETEDGEVEGGFDPFPVMLQAFVYQEQGQGNQGYYFD
jgi:hypothetical protein